MKIYKLCFCDDMTQYEVFNHIEIYTEAGLQDRLRQAIECEQLSPTTLDEWGLDENTVCEEIPADEIVKIFCDDGYECEEGWLCVPELDEKDQK